MYDIKRLFVWILRIFHCRGFGVQSPSDYAFIRYVINEHYLYYAYSDLEGAFPDVDRYTRKMCRLCFRIANFLQPSTIVNGMGESVYSEYMRAGCNRVHIFTDMSAVSKPELIVFPAREGCEELYERVVSQAGSRTILVIEGIKSSRVARRLWNAVLADVRTGVTFDLFYAGIVFFDKARYKQNYIVNF